MMNEKMPKIVKKIETYPNGLPKSFFRDPSAVLPRFIETSPEEVDQIHIRLSKSFQNGKTKPHSYRKEQLLSLYKGVLLESESIIEALARDFKSIPDSKLELHTILHEINEFFENIDSWLAPQEVSKPTALMADSAKIIKEPYGVLLNISPWNFPFMLAMDPLIGAIATGNCCLLKPSEMSPNTSAIVTHLINKFLDPECYAVANGDKEITTHILEKKWDFITYTGNGTVARIIMNAAAKNLTPTLLELGGKSPAIIDDETCDLRIAARRILWSKCLNAGQVCITSDYIICRPHIVDELVKIMKEELYNFYGNDTKDNPDWPRIVNQNHCERISRLIPTQDSPAGYGKVVHGGKYNVNDRFIEPTIITDIDPKIAPVMQGEIFGPLIPIITAENLDETIDFIKSRDKPLAMYIFSDNSKIIDRISNNVSSGGVCVNDTMMHFNISTLPFGGVGESGMGTYHGRHSIEQFTHKRAIYTANNYRMMEPIVTPRYPGQDSTLLMPVMYKHNLYPSLPSEKMSTRIQNYTVSTSRWLSSVINLAARAKPIKRES